MQYVYYNKRYNRRHLLVIAVAVVLGLCVQLFPYHAIFDARLPDTHGTCVLEIPNDPDCKEDGSVSVYVIKNGNTELAEKIDGVSSCDEYMSAPVTKPAHGDWFMLVSFLLIIVDVIAIIYFVCVAVKNLFKWLFED